MAEYMHLVGAEQVQSAGCAMRDAAERMNQAASSIHETIQRGLERADELVSRLEALAHEERSGGPKDAAGDGKPVASASPAAHAAPDRKERREVGTSNTDQLEVGAAHSRHHPLEPVQGALGLDMLVVAGTKLNQHVTVLRDMYVCESAPARAEIARLRSELAEARKSQRNRVTCSREYVERQVARAFSKAPASMSLEVWAKLAVDTVFEVCAPGTATKAVSWSDLERVTRKHFDRWNSDGKRSLWDGVDSSVRRANLDRKAEWLRDLGIEVEAGP